MKTILNRFFDGSTTNSFASAYFGHFVQNLGVFAVIHGNPPLLFFSLSLILKENTEKINHKAPLIFKINILNISQDGGGAMKERKYLDCFSSCSRGGEPMPHGFKKKAALFFTVMGPGMITAFADNDAGGIATYVTAGAHYGYAMLFTLLISTICLGVAQEISARTGLVTGKGLFVLIKEEYGKYCCIFLMVILLIANVGTTVSEFSGIAIASETFGIDVRFAVIAAAILIWFLVVHANYSAVEKIFFILCTTFFAYIITGFMANPVWGDVIKATFIPEVSTDSDFLLIAMGIVGTTITPWGQFYVQASVVDKGLCKEQYRYVAADVWIGTFFTGLVAFFVIVATAVTLYGTGYQAENLADAAQALAPLAGNYAKWLFGIGLLGASLLAAIILPLSTAYAVCEALGYPHGISKKYKEAKVFFLIYTGLIMVGAGIVLLPASLFYHLMIAAQILNGVLLPPVLIFMLLIAGNEKIMGKYKNPPVYQFITWIFTIFIILLTIMLFYTNVIALM